MAAEKPSAPATATTALSGTSAAISWVAPSENGSPILSYLVEIQGSDGGWHQDTVYCDGADPTVISTTTCSIPLTTLTDVVGDLALAPGALVAVRVSATNILGMGPASAANSAGAYVQVLPGAPTGLAQGLATSSTAIEMVWTPLATEAELGGLVSEVVISSYQLDWDAGAGVDVWTELIGYSSAYSASTYTTSAALTAGQTYRFRVRAQNAQGWGPYSSIVSVLAASAPS